MTKPTVGRIMWFYPGLYPSPASANLISQISSLPENQPYKADVCFVHNEHCVNVLVTDHIGNQSKLQNVPIIQEGSPFQIGFGDAVSGYLMWMPYQNQKHKEDAIKEQFKYSDGAPVNMFTDNKGIDPQHEGGLVAKAQEHTFDVTRVSHPSTGE